MEYKRELQESFLREGREEGGRLLSLKPPPEGGADPDDKNGSHGPGYTWGQTLSDVQVAIVLAKGAGGAD
eukprot:385092-Hanusia_phi.AAC.1